MVTSTTIPAWFVASTMILTGIMWLLTKRTKVRMDSRIFAITFILEGLTYGIIYQFFNVDIELRGFFSRLMLVILAMSQFVPLAVSYMRSINRDS